MSNFKKKDNTISMDGPAFIGELQKFTTESEKTHRGPCYNAHALTCCHINWCMFHNMDTNTNL